MGYSKKKDNCSGDSLYYKRIVVKAGTSVLTTEGEQLDRESLSSLVNQLAGLHVKGVELILVTSGAIATGRHVLGIGRSG